MTRVDQPKLSELVALAHKRFSASLRNGESEILRRSIEFHHNRDHDVDTRERSSEFRPDFLRWLLGDPDAGKLLVNQTVRVSHLHIDDRIDLSGCDLDVELEFHDCIFDKALCLNSSNLLALSVSDSQFRAGLIASNLRLRGPLDFDNVSAEVLRFDGLKCESYVHFRNVVTVGDKAELSMRQSIIATNVILWPGLKSSGTLDFSGSDIGGYVKLSDAVLTAPGVALNFDYAKVHTDVFLTDKFKSDGTVRLVGADIHGNLNCDGATLAHTGMALALDGANLDGSLFLHNGFECSGSISMHGTTVGGQVNCQRAVLTAKDKAIIGTGLRVSGGVFLHGPFKCDGTIDLDRAEIGNQLNLKGATLLATDVALSLHGALIRGDVYLHDNFTSAGRVRLHAATVHGDLVCSDATITRSGNALSLYRTLVHGSVMLTKLSATSGMIFLKGTDIRGSLDCNQASLLGFLGNNMKVGENFIWTQISSPNLTLDLTGAVVKTLQDDSGSWPAAGNLHVDGFITSQVVPLVPDQSADNRINWLSRQPESDLASPHSWLLIARLFEGQGHRRFARRVIFALRRHQENRDGGTDWLKRLWLRCFALLEEQPLRIICPIVILAGLAGAVFQRFEAHFAETSDAVYQSSHTIAARALPYPRFQPYIYALENVLPVVKLGQDEHWAPDRFGTSPTLYWSLVYLRWTLIVLGWAMGLVLASAVSTRFRS